MFSPVTRLRFVLAGVTLRDWKDYNAQLRSIDADRGDRIGTAFEYLCRYTLRTSPVFGVQFSTVDFDKPDRGADLAALMRNGGGLWGVQCKQYLDESAVDVRLGRLA